MYDNKESIKLAFSFLVRDSNEVEMMAIRKNFSYSGTGKLIEDNAITFVLKNQKGLYLNLCNRHGVILGK